MMMKGDLSWDGEHKIQCRDDVLSLHLKSGTPETYVILLTNVMTITSRK